MRGAAGLPAHGVHRRRLRRRAGARPGRARGRATTILVGGARRAAARGARTRSRSSSTRAVDTGNASQLARAARRAARRARLRGRGALPARQLHLRAGAAARSASSRSSRRIRRSCSRWRARCSTTTRTCRRWSSTSCAIDLRELAAAHPADALPVPVPLRRAGARRDGRLPRRRAAGGGRLDARRLRALAPDPRGALRPRAARARRLLPAAGRGRAGAGADAAQVLPARARHRARRRAADRAVGREPRGGPAARCGRWPGVTACIDLADSVVYGHLWATDGDARAVRRRGPHARLAGHHRRARGRAGRARADPGRGRARDRRPGRATGSTSTPSARRRARTRPLDARADPRAAARRSGRRPREWVYYGATVQDVTDTWTGLVMQRHARDRAARPGGDRGRAARRSPSATATR